MDTPNQERKILMGYKVNEKVSKVSFNIPTVIKEELEDYCIDNDRIQSQVLRESVFEFIRFSRRDKSNLVKQVG
jgi:hypothetical protein